MIGRTVTLQPRGGVVLLHEGRVGSTALGVVLDRQPRLFWDGEAYTKLAVNGKNIYKAHLRSSELPKIYLSKRTYHSLGATYGVEIKFNQISKYRDCVMEELIMLKELFPVTSFVVLVRKNMIRRLVSILNGIQRGVWHSGQPSNSRISIDVDDIGGWGITLIEWLEKGYEHRLRLSQALDAMGEHVLNLNFEDDISVDPALGG